MAAVAVCWLLSGVVAVAVDAFSFDTQAFDEVAPSRCRVLVRSLESTAFAAIAHRAAGIDVTPQVSPSVHTCEQVSTISESRDGEGVDGFHPGMHATDATDALLMGKSRGKDRRKKIDALLQAGEPGKARRLAYCRRQSVQLGCPTMAGGCGSDDNYVPATCDSRLCPECGSDRMGRLMEKYRSVVSSMRNPTFLTFTQTPSDSAVEGKDAITAAFRRFRQRKVPPSGDGWMWHTDPARNGDAWKASLMGQKHHKTARRWQQQYIEQGRWIPMQEILRSGVYGVDIKQQQTGKFHVHIHCLADVPYLPQKAMASVWSDCGGGEVVDIRRVRDRDGDGLESALLELVGYVSKPPSFESLDDEVEAVLALHGSRLVQPFGEAHGNVPPIGGMLECACCEVAPAWWHYIGVVDGNLSNMGMTSAADGDRPPD